MRNVLRFFGFLLAYATAFAAEPISINVKSLKPGLHATYSSSIDNATLYRVDAKPALALGDSSPHPRLPTGLAPLARSPLPPVPAVATCENLLAPTRNWRRAQASAYEFAPTHPRQSNSNLSTLRRSACPHSRQEDRSVCAGGKFRT